jgi:sirohydrochlorin ferrochelatase
MSQQALTILVDNGSLEPAPTLALRELATRLGEKLGERVEPVSLLHSSGTDPSFLGGTRAEILLPAIEQRLAQGQNEFILLPLFFGPSRALTVYLPENLQRLRTKYPHLNIQLAPPLFSSTDDRLAAILADHVRAHLDPSGTDRVALVDHGSPVPAVTSVRNKLARQLGTLLGVRVMAVAPCSMERRPGPDYDFCAPLLGDLLATSPWTTSRVIVAMQFLLPGRHAGPGGDVAQICELAQSAQPKLHTTMTKLVGEHPLLLDILVDRWRQKSALPSPSMPPF